MLQGTSLLIAAGASSIIHLLSTVIEWLSAAEIACRSTIIFYWHKILLKFSPTVEKTYFPPQPKRGVAVSVLSSQSLGDAGLLV